MLSYAEFSELRGGNPTTTEEQFDKHIELAIILTDANIAYKFSELKDEWKAKYAQALDLRMQNFISNGVYNRGIVAQSANGVSQSFQTTRSAGDLNDTDAALALLRPLQAR